MSMKSITISPPMSRRRSWRAISSAASRLVLRAVASMSPPRVERAELMSMETSASVWSMTRLPPDGRVTLCDLAFDLIAREQRHGILIELQLALGVRRHEPLHVLLRLLKRLGLVDQALAHIVRKIVAQSARDGVALLEYQERRGAPLVRLPDGVPGGLQIVEIPLQLFRRPADSGRAHDGSHALGDDQIVHGLAHLIAILALDAPGDAARAGIVRHEHQEAPRQADERGERRALVAAFLLLHLDDEFLALLEEILDVQPPARGGLRTEEFLGYLLERQEAVALSAVFDECRFETGLYAGDPAFIDIGFFLFPGRDLDR
jgi:hypothetical protein